MAIRARQNFLSGIISGTITTSTTSLTGTVGSANFPTPAAGYYTPIILNPGYFGATNTTGPEVVFVQPGGSTSVAIVTRGQDGTSATVTGANIPWVAGPIVSDFDVSNLTSSGTLVLNNGLTVSTGTLTVTQGGVVVSGYSTFYSSLNLNNSANLNGVVSTNTQYLNVYSGANFYNGLIVQSGNATVNNALTTSGLTVQNNTVISGNLSVSGTITATNNEFNGSWYSKTLVNTGSLPNGSAAALPAVQVTVSGYSRYMIVANSSYINNTSTSCIVWSYITDSSFNQSTLAYTTLPSTTGTSRANLGNNLIVNYGNNTQVTFSLNVYSDHTTTGGFGAAEISVIGLS